MKEPIESSDAGDWQHLRWLIQYNDEQYEAPPPCSPHQSSTLNHQTPLSSQSTPVPAQSTPLLARDEPRQPIVARIEIQEIRQVQDEVLNFNGDPVDPTPGYRRQPGPGDQRLEAADDADFDLQEFQVATTRLHVESSALSRPAVPRSIAELEDAHS